MTKMHKSSTDKVIDGVCGGISEYLSVDSVWVRLAWVAATIFTHGGGVIAYIIAAVIVPRQSATDITSDHGQNTADFKRSSWLFGATFIALGIIFLLNNFGLIPWTVYEAWGYAKKIILPGILLCLGVYLLVRNGRKRYL